MNPIILVDKDDNIIGYGEKLPVHQKDQLHRAFSIFLYDRNRKQLMLQKRADGKYHSGGLWTNSCCSHPRKDETWKEALENRLQEELGYAASFEIVDLTGGNPERMDLREYQLLTSEYVQSGNQPLKGCASFIPKQDDIYFMGKFKYFAPYGDLSEHEIDNVFVYFGSEEGFREDEFSVNPEEASEIMWISLEELDAWLAEKPEEFTAWFAGAYNLARDGMCHMK